MKILDIHPVNPQQRLIDKVIGHLRSGGLLAYPTDTCYGLGCSIFEKKAIDEIYRIKRLPEKKPLSIICNDLTNIAEYAAVSNRAYKLMRKLLPGPYTFVLPATRKVPKLLQNKQRQVGIRVPNHPVILEIVRQLDHPIITTTCQGPEDEMPCADVWEIKEQFGNFFDLAIDGGYIYPEVSTIISIDVEQIEVLREGKGDLEPFQAFLDSEA